MLLNSSESHAPSVEEIVPLYPTAGGKVMGDNAWRALERGTFLAVFYNPMHCTSSWLKPVVPKLFTH